MTAISRERFAGMRALFHILVDETSEHRRARLDQIAADDAELAMLLQDLLARADRAGIEAPDDASAVGAARARQIGVVLGGRYRIERLLGTGGMGDVYLAERSDGIEQKVALKMLRGHDASLIGRFVRERQILARLSHPHIAHLLDGGLTDAGVPWFAMEYVDGAFITEACDSRGLGLRARVALFVQVCHAVQFAHRNLVLHRDLKPSNILVDAEGAPKLLDFGIARLLDDTAPFDRPQTQTMTMTPAYAAPEQLRGEAVTTASDVYQLGLVLCELLAGVSARELRERRTQGAGDASVKPLQRPEQAFVSTPAPTAERIALDRGLVPARLRRALHGDLDRIVAKAIAEDPRERYETAQALGDDLERWSAGLPVRAQRGSFSYRTGKLLRRHAAAAVLVALLALGLIAASIVAINRAEQEYRQRQRAETVLAFMRDIFRQGDPENGGSADTRAGELLEKARTHLETRTDLDDVTRAVLFDEIGDVFKTMGLYTSALPSVQRAVAILEPIREAHPAEYLEAATNLIEILRDFHQVSAEMTAIERVLPFAQRTRAGTQLWHAMILMCLSSAQIQLGDLDAAQQAATQAVAEFEKDGAHASTDFATAVFGLGWVAENRGDNRRALGFYQRAADMQHASSEATKTSTLTIDLVAARTQCALGVKNAGVAALTSLSEKFDALLGPEHSRTMFAQADLARCAMSRGEYAEASKALKAIPATSVESAPIDQSKTRLVLYELRNDEAQTDARANLRSIAAQNLSPKFLLNAHWLLGEALLQANRCAEGVPELTEALRLARIAAANTPVSMIGEAEDSLGRCKLLEGDATTAQALFAQAVEQFQIAQTPSAPAALRSRIHRLWAEALATRDVRLLDSIESLRANLVEDLGSDARPQIWQLDLLLDDLNRQLGRPGIDPARRKRAEAALKAMAGTPQLPHFVGLNSFS